MRHRTALVMLAVLVLSGCHRREITSLERKEAANVVSEADFAVTLKDWGRAEGLFSKAVALCPDQGDTWVNLGMVRMRMGNKDGARSAFKSALSAYSDDLGREPFNSLAVLRKAYVLVILRRTDEAKSMVAKAYSKHPDDRELRSFVGGNGVDRMASDPGLKEISP